VIILGISKILSIQPSNTIEGYRGHISREYAAGLGRLDLCIEFAGERFAIAAG
jgi:hypothetical protein